MTLTVAYALIGNKTSTIATGNSTVITIIEVRNATCTTS